MIALAALILSLAVIYLSAVRMRQANHIYARSRREIDTLASVPRELSRNRKALEKQSTDLKEAADRATRNIEQLKLEREGLEEDLERLRNQPRDRLYMMERGMQPGLNLWEVTVGNDTLFRNSGHPGLHRSWTEGRRYLVASPSDKDARRRAELRFLSAQGYRIVGIQKTTRI
jgi:cell division protein FtsB